MADCDKVFALMVFGDDNAIGVAGEEKFWGLGSVEAMSAEVTFAMTDNVLVFGVVGVEHAVIAFATFRAIRDWVVLPYGH